MTKVVFTKPIPEPSPMPGWLVGLFTLAGLALFVWVVIAVVGVLLS